MESYIPISYLNDFIFCPRSIYYHQLYNNFSKIVYQGAPQARGTEAHASIDSKTYSNDTSWLIGTDIYSEKYKLCGKIDLYHTKRHLLRERKREIKAIYDGYIFQVYAQCFCLEEMGYLVDRIELYDMTHNKIYPIPLPSKDDVMFEKFNKVISEIACYDLDAHFIPNNVKCENCIYSSLCDLSAC